ncbi:MULTISPECIES: LicD family protein [Enterococcus]|uniref:LicD family protein n=1 Tax=Enterococcus TaxID=1350 RepID=UPI0002A43188|nr:MULTISPECIES: LicD family protein [Enterococcus]EGP4735601.1 LicD family protein [Enterococcus faecium]EGP4925281.1 LicD family protein [Enterococcus faecium]ELB50756.1 hypothetical protein OKI_04171 [Enterococcus faecium EnGen0038]EME3509217.1 LicD family protein [Enterococcus faecium]EME7195129.1 LicD family protein [Enterococcus faecium]
MENNRKIQELTLYTLKTFIKFCEKHNLKYYFTGGALIGVLRHKGFIPWDDDIDIGMPRKDFDRFHELIKKEMPEGFGICDRHTDKDWHFAMSQFIDKETEIEINIAEKTRKAHIWIDVFPLDGLPSNKFSRWFKVKYILFHRYLIQVSHISTQVDSRKKRPMTERIVLRIFKLMPIGKLINTTKVLDHLEKVLRTSNFDDSEWCGNMLGRYREKEVVLTKWFGSPVKGEFEGELVNIPENSHAILKALYEDYMKLPPKESQIAHGVQIIKCRDIWEIKS